ncbi:MAG: ribbon-helix-helix domain-containing protein [Pseudomonadota bacterium]
MCHVFAGQDPERYVCATRRLRLNGQSTSIRLEQSFWDILDELAANDGMTTPAFISTLHSEVLELRGEPSNFTSLLRCACLKFLELKAGATETSLAAE